jgi:glycerophosphoryl diester phosphodiesterase
VTYLDAILLVVRRSRQLVALARNVIVRLLLLALPFLAAVGAIYTVFLGEHDINFYLADRPPEFRRALILAGIVGVAFVALAVSRIAGWIFSLPTVLFEGLGGRASLRASVAATAGRRFRITLWLVGWMLAVLALSFLVTRLIGSVAGLFPKNLENVVLVLVGLGVVLLLMAIGNLSLSVLANALFPLVIVRLYRSMGGSGELPGRVAARGSLGERATFSIPGRLLVWGAVAALIVVGGGGYLVVRSVSPEDDTVIIAHRGASGAAPENTMAAFERAIADDTDWIELDVQENADGVVVVEHDSDFMKVAGVKLKVWDATSDDLRDIDIGSFFDPRFADQRVPTLREVLERVKGEAGVVIELKYYGHDRNLEAKVVEIVESLGMASDVMVMSLKYDGVRKTAKLRPDWTYGLLTTVSVGDLTRLDLDFLAVNASAASPSLIRRAHKRGMMVFVWTVNDPVQMSVMLSRGVDGLITDEPALAREVIEVRDELTSVGRLIVWIAGEFGLLTIPENLAREKDA